jgi:hypothetical protein
MDENSKLPRRLKSLFKTFKSVLFGDFEQPLPLERNREVARLRLLQSMSKGMLQREIEKWSSRAEMARQQGNDELAEQALSHKRDCEEELAEVELDFETIRRAENGT